MLGPKKCLLIDQYVPLCDELVPLDLSQFERMFGSALFLGNGALFQLPRFCQIDRLSNRFGLPAIQSGQ